MKLSLTNKIAFIATALALVVVLLGAFTRLVDAGLGCPDWPGCYGHFSVPTSSDAIQKANEAYPHMPVESEKAWPEMIHRYFAGTLGLLIFAIGYLAIKNKDEMQSLRGLAFGLIGLVIFQALLGMWTVTKGLWPLTVMGHLLGGFLTLNLLWYLSLQIKDKDSIPVGHELKPFVLIGMLVVFVQISLGGWTSSNYAAIICEDFPTCQGSWWPPMDFLSAFQLWGHGVTNYQGGILGNDARVTIQWVHRLGAYATIAYMSWLLVRLWRYDYLRRFVYLIGVLLTIQVVLGISNVLLSLPLTIAVLHNAGAAMVLLSLVTLYHYMVLPNGGVQYE